MIANNINYDCIKQFFTETITSDQLIEQLTDLLIDYAENCQGVGERTFVDNVSTISLLIYLIRDIQK